ncbi:MAG: helix-turn-helix transcriptional regulator [Clostridiaceae bacterium]|nr:helix-turn-helix transcriptional regulator [Clostridiaceae bacterium]
MSKELLRGSIDILLLSLLEKEDLYGYTIAKKLKEKSNELYSMSEGTLYPALQRMEKQKYLKSYWGDSESGSRRKNYSITEEGKRDLVDQLKTILKIEVKNNEENLVCI